ncbi:MAG: HpsJ family protein, partial [Halothece sp. Uz-M2-17]|nr:HpsJ family protein [Halothece sp. Uz-M2-17]
IGATDNQGFFILLNWLGYIILFVSAIDYFVILYPPQLTNTNWEFQTMNRLVNNAWFLLLGLMLIFIPTRARIRRFELSFIKFLRWIILLGGATFILLVPLTLVNANRLHDNAMAQLGQQQGNQQEQLNNVQEALENESLSFFQLQRLREQFNIENVPESSTLEQTLITEIEERKQQLRQQVDNQKQNRFRQIFGQGIRNSLAGLLIGAFLIRLWWEARWVKRLK